MNSHVFVDGTNLDRRLEVFDGRGMHHVNLEEFFSRIVGGEWLHVHYFTSPYLEGFGRARHKNQNLVFTRLRRLQKSTTHLGVHEVRNHICEGCDETRNFPVEKKTDVALAVEMVRCALNYPNDRVIVVTNDTDMVPAMKLCRELGRTVKLVHVHSDMRGPLAELRKHSSESLALTPEFMDLCWLPAHKLVVFS